jgi:hypothetical protein
MSAQETTPGQRASMAALALSMMAWREALGGPSFSAVTLAVESRRTDASHPCSRRLALLEWRGSSTTASPAQLSRSGDLDRDFGREEFLRKREKEMENATEVIRQGPPCADVGPM